MKIEELTINPDKLSEELKRRLEAVRDALRCLEEAKSVTQGTMQTEVSI